jgi:hypothetical protein
VKLRVFNQRTALLTQRFPRGICGKNSCGLLDPNPFRLGDTD